MNYLIDEANQLNSEVVEELNEASGNSQKNYYIHGVFSTPDMKNRNGRIYSRAIWEKEVAKYQIELKNKTINTLGEFQHPPRSTVSQMDAVMRIIELKMEDGVVKGRAKILNNNSKETNQIKALIDEGIKVGVSSRGVGKVNNGIVEEFKLITYDLVTDPSDYNANLTGLTESLNESIGSTNFEVDENGNIYEICTESACHMFEKTDIQEAIKQKFNEVLKTLK